MPGHSLASSRLKPVQHHFPSPESARLRVTALVCCETQARVRIRSEMTAASQKVETVVLGEKTAWPLTIPRIVTGLWQLAGGHDEKVDVATCAGVMSAYTGRGLTAFDMADRECCVEGETDDRLRSEWTALSGTE